MKIRSLRLAGFGPYKTEQFVDFEAFDDDGIFLITGKTGAGKSSILDAICFALYARVPRYDGRESQLRSDHSGPDDPTFVELVFRLGDDDYRLFRTPEYERPKKRGGGMMTAPPEARLEIGDGAGGWRGLAAKPVDVGREMAEILPLKAEQFLQVILLAQNRFQQFLLAKTEERRVLLRTLFGTLRFEVFEKTLGERSRALAAQAAEAQQGVAMRAGTVRALVGDRAAGAPAGAPAGVLTGVPAVTPDWAAGGSGAGEPAHPTKGVPTGAAGGSGERSPDGFPAGSADASSKSEPQVLPGGFDPLAEPDAEWFEAAVHLLTAEYDEADRRAVMAEQELEGRRVEHEQQVELHRRQSRRAEALGRLGALEGQSGAVDALREAIATANRAARAWPQVDARRRADRALDDARTEESTSRGRWEPIALEAAGELSRNGNSGEAGSAGFPRETETGAGADPAAGPEIDAGAVAGPEVNAGAGAGAGAVAGASGPGELRVVVERLLGLRGALEGALAEERQIPELTSQLAELEGEQGARAVAVTEAEMRTAMLPAEIDHTAAAIAAAALGEGRLADLTATQERLTLSLEAARSADLLDERRLEARAEQKSASAAAARAAAAFDAVLGRQLEGTSAVLAARLEPGEPCSVCGSREHPHPATSDVEPVTDADVQLARDERTRLHDESTAADAAAELAAAAVAEARAGAGGRSVAELVVETEAASAAVTAAHAAAHTRLVLEAKRETLLAERESAEERLRHARSELTTAHLAVETQRNRLIETRSRLARQQGTFPSVRARGLEIDRWISAAREYERALSAVAEALSRQTLAVLAERESLDELAFDDDLAVDGALLPAAELRSYEARVRQHDDGLAACRSTLAEPELADLPEAAVDTEQSRAAVAVAVAASRSASALRSALAARREQLTPLVAEARELFGQSAALLSEQSRVRELAEVVAGTGSNVKKMRLETYVLAAELEEIIRAANARLGTMTSGRYALELDDSVQYRAVSSGLGLSIRDSHTGRPRPTHSLSGGEMFLASLALALGLAEVVSNRAGGIALDTLFVDEGFGSLDSETLAVAMGALDSLRSGGRTIGLISHVESMKEQIPAKLRIHVTAGGDSQIEETRELVAG